MLVTKIERQKRNAHRINLFLDGRFAFGVDDEVLVRSGIRTGDHLTGEALESIRESGEKSLAKSRALKSLSRRLRTEAEVRSDLLENEFHPRTVDRVIEELRAMGLIDDTRFARAFVHDARMRRALGRIALQRELLRKGVPRQVILDELASSARPDDEVAAAFSAASTLLSRFRASRKRLPPEKERERAAQFLGRRGYDWEIISGVLRRLFGAGE